jgi:hypothetical protein
VNDTTGILMSDKPTKEEVANAIIQMASSNEKYHPYKFWKEYFDADCNYSNFVEYLSNDL